jgi:hypothetical protein
MLVFIATVLNQIPGLPKKNAKFYCGTIVEYEVTKIFYIAHKHKISPYSTKKENLIYISRILLAFDFFLSFQCSASQNKIFRSIYYLFSNS